MQGYVLRENIRQYQELLGRETDDSKRRTLAKLLVACEREYALLAANVAGIDEPSARVTLNKAPGSLSLYLDDFCRNLASSGRLLLLLEPGPGLPILDASDAYAAATMKRRADLIGRNLFEVFPDNPADPDADGVANLYASLRTAASSGRPHRMAVQRYDVRNADGEFEERYWQPENSPIIDDDGNLIALLHEVADVTATVNDGRS